MVRADVAVVLALPNCANTASTWCWAGAISSGFSAEAAISPCAMIRSSLGRSKSASIKLLSSVASLTRSAEPESSINPARFSSR